RRIRRPIARKARPPNRVTTPIHSHRASPVMKLPWSTPAPWKIQMPPVRQHSTPRTERATLTADARSSVQPAAVLPGAGGQEAGGDRDRDLLRGLRADVEAHRGADPPEVVVAEAHVPQGLDVRTDVAAAPEDADEPGRR